MINTQQLQEMSGIEWTWFWAIQAIFREGPCFTSILITSEMIEITTTQAYFTYNSTQPADDFRPKDA